MRAKNAKTTLLIAAIVACAPAMARGETTKARPAGRLAELQQHIQRGKAYFRQQRDAAARLPAYAVSHVVEAVGGIFGGIGLGHQLGLEVGIQRSYDGKGRVQPSLRVGVFGGTGFGAGLGALGMKKVLRGKLARPFRLWGAGTTESAFVLGAGVVHGRSEFGTDYRAGGFGLGLMVMDGGRVKDNDDIVQGNHVHTARGGVTIPLWQPVRSGWARAAEQGLAVTERLGALLAGKETLSAKEIAEVDTLLRRAEELEKKVARVGAKRRMESEPTYHPLDGLDSSL